jgi:hypothetical protein
VTVCGRYFAFVDDGSAMGGAPDSQPQVSSCHPPSCFRIRFLDFLNAGIMARRKSAYLGLSYFAKASILRFPRQLEIAAVLPGTVSPDDQSPRCRSGPTMPANCQSLNNGFVMSDDISPARAREIKVSSEEAE